MPARLGEGHEEVPFDERIGVGRHEQHRQIEEVSRDGIPQADDTDVGIGMRAAAGHEERRLVRDARVDVHAALVGRAHETFGPAIRVGTADPAAAVLRIADVANPASTWQSATTVRACDVLADHRIVGVEEGKDVRETLVQCARQIPRVEIRAVVHDAVRELVRHDIVLDPAIRELEPLFAAVAGEVLGVRFDVAGFVDNPRVDEDLELVAIVVVRIAAERVVVEVVGRLREVERVDGVLVGLEPVIDAVLIADVVVLGGCPVAAVRLRTDEVVRRLQIELVSLVRQKDAQQDLAGVGVDEQTLRFGIPYRHLPREPGVGGRLARQTREAPIEHHESGTTGDRRRADAREQPRPVLGLGCRDLGNRIQPPVARDERPARGVQDVVLQDDGYLACVDGQTLNRLKEGHDLTGEPCVRRDAPHSQVQIRAVQAIEVFVIVEEEACALDRVGAPDGNLGDDAPREPVLDAQLGRDARGGLKPAQGGELQIVQGRRPRRGHLEVPAVDDAAGHRDAAAAEGGDVDLVVTSAGLAIVDDHHAILCRE